MLLVSLLIFLLIIVGEVLAVLLPQHEKERKTNGTKPCFKASRLSWLNSMVRSQMVTTKGKENSKANRPPVLGIGLALAKVLRLTLLTLRVCLVH